MESTFIALLINMDKNFNQTVGVIMPVNMNLTSNLMRMTLKPLYVS